MIVEDHSSGVAGLLLGYVLAGKLNRFAAMVEEGYDPWECICAFEDELLAFRSRNRWCGCLDGWQIVVGWADDMKSVPLYVGWGAVEAWLEYGDACCTIEPEYGVICRQMGDFVERHKSVPLASSPLADDSAITLNRAFKERAALEGVL